MRLKERFRSVKSESENDGWPEAITSDRRVRGDEKRSGFSVAVNDISSPIPSAVIAAIATVIVIIATKYPFGVFRDLALHGRLLPEELLKVIMLFEESAVVSELRVRLQLCGGLGMLLEK